MEIEVGALVDRRYRLKREIARGGTGAVFEAEHVFTRRSVALKLLLPTSQASPEARERLLREAQALTVARHPNVVHALDAGETEDGTPFLVLELLEGRTLAGILAVRHHLGPAEAVALGQQICGGLGAAHTKNILHRDLKPSNIFVALDGTGQEAIKIFDFGIAQVPTTDRKLTQHNSVVGTPEYMAPEQLLMRTELDQRCDLYALGVTLYECLAGVVPYEGNFGEVLLRVNTEPLPRLRTRAPEVPEKLAQVVERALARAPEERYPSARAFAQALAENSTELPRAGSLLGLGLPSCGAPPTPFALVSLLRPLPPPLPEQRRRFHRAPYVTPVSVYRRNASPLEGRSEDISVGGLLVLMPLAYRQSESVRIRFALPLTGVVLEAAAVGRWQRTGRGVEAVGFEFASLPPEPHEEIERYVSLKGAAVRDAYGF